MRYDQDKIIELYKKGDTLREVARKIGCSMQWVHYIIKKRAPFLMKKPYVGKLK